jgi:hypothetical protein
VVGPWARLRSGRLSAPGNRKRIFCPSLTGLLPAYSRTLNLRFRWLPKIPMQRAFLAIEDLLDSRNR